ncbi:MAG: hypothetical protein A2506_06750 [Elusimicrobia bacterium RIFOXYD12_FULL_66_9]|nr:MAG: hypothetical protein A2506_06750 [Elusimicrobia bacterium RIFOXYD12_FULL_66_9]
MTDDLARTWTDRELEEIARELLAIEPISDIPPRRRRSMLTALLSVTCLVIAFDLCVTVDSGAHAARPRPAARPADPLAREAIVLAQRWRLAGDELPVLERLGRSVRNPANGRGWIAGRTDGDTYLVVFREPAGFPAYAFEVDLASGRVVTSPETVERLTALRLRDEAPAHQVLVASAR